jgi:hypothetical protein
MKTNGQLNSNTALDRQKTAAVATDVLRVVIPYTTPELTRTALHHAGTSTGLGVWVTLIDVQVVPFPCPMDQPPINKKYSQHRLEELLRETGLNGHTSVLYTRDLAQGFRQALGSNSLVILAGKKRWWPTRQKRLARDLSKAGHQVMLLQT